MIRPEAKAQIRRWREALIGISVLVFGLWVLSRGGIVLALAGAPLAIGGAALIWMGLQRGRFRGAGQGPGAVNVDEGQVTYFGPLTGGSVALRDITRIVLDARQFPSHWRLQQQGGAPLLIPVNAAGAETLFDAFATLPGFRMEPTLKSLRAPSGEMVLVWRRDPPASRGRTDPVTRH